uniref:Transposase n=1 Tax=Archaeoglobus fulgidus TaxID=2234 RepID=A0A7J2TIB4_ARCFL
MISDKLDIEKIVDLIKKEIESSELTRKIIELDSKLVELKKTIESLVIELTYIKEELRELRGDKKKPFEIKTEKRQQRVSENEKERKELQISKPEEKRIERIEKRVDEEDLIICD